jgi:enoyl-CoA hydratase/carnithine racemase
MGGLAGAAPRQIPRCEEILLTGEQIPARRALEMGLISKVVSRALEGEALRYARNINEAGPLAVQAIDHRNATG